MNAHRTEKGQVLLMIALALVAMFGFAALAVDVGNIFAERRKAQSAADAAAFAAAFRASEAINYRLKITESDLNTIVLKKAQENGYISKVGDDPANPFTVVEYFHPPSTGPYVGNLQYYQVRITTTVNQIFSQIIFPSAQRLTVEAVARARPVQSIFPGDALHATNDSACAAIDFNGTSDIEIIGGNVFSNSSGKTGSCEAGNQNGSGSVSVTGGGINMVGDWRQVGSGSVSPAPVSGVGAKPMPDIPMPDCSGLSSRGAIRNTGGDVQTIQPGKYDSIDVNGGKVTMAPGMYCLYGDFGVGGNAELEGTNVFIVMMSGSIDFLGGGTVRLTKPTKLEDASGQNWGGFLIYMPFENSGGIDIGGNSGSSYSGTIFAPGPRDPASKSKCRVQGSGSNIGVSANVVCNTITVGGTATVYINFKEEENYRLPPIIELAQ